jgi:hypothetical protein
MFKTLALAFVVSCATTPPPKIQTPEDYQSVVADLVAQVIDIFRTDGTNCDMLTNDLHTLKASSKFTVAHDWGTSHPDGPQLAQAKIDEKKADFDTASAPALRACGGGLAAVLAQLTKK